ncbi:hypothetical protein M404DRAFT_33989 [Pisolithus tinctorius Marx 270]|uniref:Uncharacterized protein n=1 Tax=Pisolithus tinctorius Marx 270 TaxID=870435 RepID=A0A0C3NIV0_PISTI|nr:hypothetical protein M404DRAFT_33989 [Pisolithus tinctorius Marx 270]
MDSPHSVNTENDYTDLAESIYNPTSDFPELPIPPINIYAPTSPPMTTTCIPGLDSSSPILQFRLLSLPGFSVCQVLAPKARDTPSGVSNQRGKGKGEETADHDPDHKGASHVTPNAPKPPHLCTAFTTYSEWAGHAALDLLTTVTSAQDDEP